MLSMRSARGTWATFSKERMTEFRVACRMDPCLLANAFTRSNAFSTLHTHTHTHAHMFRHGPLQDKPLQHWQISQMAMGIPDHIMLYALDVHLMCTSMHRGVSTHPPTGSSNPGFPAVCSKRLGSDQSQITQARLPVLRSPASIRADAYEDIVALISGKHPGVIRLLVQLESLVHITLPRTHHQQAAIGGCCWYQIPRRLHLLKHLQ